MILSLQGSSKHSKAHLVNSLFAFSIDIFNHAFKRNTLDPWLLLTNFKLYYKENEKVDEEYRKFFFSIELCTTNLPCNTF